MRMHTERESGGKRVMGGSVRALGEGVASREASRFLTFSVLSAATGD